ncbi:MAG: cobyric acid synthase [Desulfosalsimonadaceae bacterium]|nr:cobyric acid synthase [Desulfosalsimonadaceae bacterium]
MHGGNVEMMARQAGCTPDELLDFSANINPMGPPSGMWADLSRAGEFLPNYPDPDCLGLRESAAQFYGCGPKQVLPGNGSTELLFAAVSALKPRRVVLPAPCYVDYAKAAQSAGIPVEWVALEPDNNFKLAMDHFDGLLRPGDMVIIGRPNNPTGHCPEKAFLESLAAGHPETLFLIDEAFIDLTEQLRLTQDKHPNLLLLRSLTKNFAIPGLRLGLLCAASTWIDKVKATLPPWSVGSLAQAVGRRLFEESAYLAMSRDRIRQEREFLIGHLSGIQGIQVFPGAANFLLMKLSSPQWSGLALQRLLMAHRIAIRVCDDYEGLNGQFVRIAVKTHEDNLRLVAAIQTAFGRKPAVGRKQTPAIMFQGTSSDAGKSVLTAALCRILRQDGVRVAPFKAQNMSLNSFVTADGLEMGRAQVTQAMAAGLPPDVRMNPVLLKPSSETGAQVIVRGRSVAHLDVKDYVAYKETAFSAVRECYGSLASEHDAMVIEGAGSPGEINLKQHDIVNMRMARLAGSPVLLVGDIDRGGVFASFIGTYTVLEPWEKRLLAGFVVNRFRGDMSLLGQAMDMTHRYTGRPTFGIIDYLPGLGLPEEDSVAFKTAAVRQCSGFSAESPDMIDIAILDLPHISNFTDIDALRIEPDVSVRVIRAQTPLGNPDLLILPGSKSVASDLRWLRAGGRAEELMAYYRNGGRILGICGGFQMLGRAILDPDHVESSQGTMEGLGLFACTTTLAREKTLKRTRARHVTSGETVDGYEIHHGVTLPGEEAAWLQSEDGPAGVISGDGRLAGTYLHGLFDADRFRRRLLNDIRKAKGWPAILCIRAYNIDANLDRLADHVRSRMDMAQIYRLMGL